MAFSLGQCNACSTLHVPLTQEQQEELAAQMPHDEPKKKKKLEQCNCVSLLCR